MRRDEDFLGNLVRRIREQGVDARVDPRMSAAGADTTYLIFYGPPEELEDADSPGPIGLCDRG
jgi:hypothetical protein